MPPLHFYKSGEGFTVLLLHGFCESGNLWRSLSRELSDDFQIICPDLPGFGKSPLSNRNFSLEDIADELVNWSKAQGIQSCVVIGHSLGGYISLEILRKYPDFAKGIGLINSSAFEDPADKKENRNKLIEFIQEHGVAPFLSTFLPSLFYPETLDAHQGIINELREDGMSIAAESVIGYSAAMRDRSDSTDLLNAYHDRILLISGEYDQNVPMEKSKAMAAYLGKENVHVVPDSAHMSIFEQRELCYNALTKFVKKFS
jgi:pimeloyl-ACP methyl ester carboxylesterase